MHVNIVQASSYAERAEKLIGKVKEIFNSLSMADGGLMSPVDDLLQHLSMVDNVERLGIDRHFCSLWTTLAAQDNELKRQWQTLFLPLPINSPWTILIRHTVLSQ